MMSLRSSPIQVLREHHRASGFSLPSKLTPVEATTVEVATALQNAVGSPEAEWNAVLSRSTERMRGVLRAGAPSSAWFDPSGTDSPTAAIRGLMHESERGRPHRLASHVYESLAEHYPLESLEGGRILMQRAMDAQNGGQDEMARGRAVLLLQIARRLRNDELRYMAWIAFSVVAHTRGNIPALSRAANRSLKYALRVGNPSIIGVARGVRAIVTAERGDNERALVDTWDAITRYDLHSSYRANLLGNLAEILYKCGRFRAARAARAECLRLPHSVVQAMVNLGGYAANCAALGDVNGVRWAAREITALTVTEPPSRHMAQGILGCADACADAGLMDLANDLFAKGMAIADAKGYHDLRFRQDPTTRSAAAPKPLRLGSAAEEARESIQQLAPDGVSLDLVLATS